MEQEQNMQPSAPQEGGGAGKYIVGIIIIVIIIAVAVFWVKVASAPASTDTTGAANQTPAAENQTATPATAATQTVEVDFTDSGFTPNSVTINAGDTVKFINKSSEGMWVGSAMHPSHAVYSGTTLKEHCPDTAGTAFDQCSTGDEFSFTFNKVGSWGYHNHVDASKFGKVIVQ